MDDEVRKQIFEDFKKMITTESVVGQPIYLGDATIVPFVDISFGFGTGSQGTNAVGRRRRQGDTDRRPHHEGGTRRAFLYQECRAERHHR